MLIPLTDVDGGTFYVDSLHVLSVNAVPGSRVVTAFELVGTLGTRYCAEDVPSVVAAVNQARATVYEISKLRAMQYDPTARVPDGRA